MKWATFCDLCRWEKKSIPIWSILVVSRILFAFEAEEKAGARPYYGVGVCSSNHCHIWIFRPLFLFFISAADVLISTGNCLIKMRHCHIFNGARLAAPGIYLIRLLRLIGALAGIRFAWFISTYDRSLNPIWQIPDFMHFFFSCLHACAADLIYKPIGIGSL